jgi:cathepsin H
MKFALVAVLCIGALAFTTSSKWDSMISGEVAASDDSILAMYKDWLVIYEKDTTNLADVMQRFSVFKSKAQNVFAHNQDKTQSWKKGINAWSDLTDAEFETVYPTMMSQECSATNTQAFLGTDENLPETKDWRDCGIVSPVKDQGSCGSCWAFSTSGTFESHYAIQTGKTGNERQEFAEQQLVDCAGDFDNNGCSGGLPSHAFQYIYYNGFMAENDYDYHAKDEVCKFNDEIVVGSDFGAFNLTESDEYSMK